MSLPRDRLVTYLNEYLEIAAWDEKSLNGLQVEGAAEVERVALATDAALATFAMAQEAGAAFLIVHHGLFWGRVEPVVGPQRARIAALLGAGISLYAAHLPLDAHPGVGNNAVLARLLKVENLVPFGRWGGRTLGWRGLLRATTDRAGLAAGLEALLQARPDVLPFGADEIRSVAIVSGAAADLVDEAAAAGVDAFVTGETSHVAWHRARELGMNVFFAGHYATETLGVRALGDHLAGEFGVETVFLDSPTGY
ncbi:MAG TPA: Nif3-like dinuclear metal center hexameric protein [Gemmatimonadota bacterium]|nr:Nif3-like dinuclear metal center hexameric protein [Gemmatimonadota bacterium]